ncbi:MAG TPA: hypothetical protein VGI19_14400 [Candidatus Cybelea sp.]|jgi:hypothetical protein
MERFSRLALILGCVVAFTAAGCAQNAVTTTVPGARTNATRQLPTNYVGTRWTSRRSFVPTGRGTNPEIGSFGYNGGPVLIKPRLYLIFWGYHGGGDPDGVKALLVQYAKSVGGSSHDNIYTQYYGPSKQYIQNPRNQFGKAWFDDAAIPANPTDKQVAAQALRFVKRFGYDPNGSYVVATAHDHNSIGFGTQWCAYHGATFDGKQVISYTNLPYIPDAGANCGANYLSPPKDESGDDEGVTIIEGAMYGDSITDPYPDTGWYPEIGFWCAWDDIELDPFGKHAYATQPMFSLASNSCVQSYKK